MAIHILGIRHHGPGSARNVKQYLENIQPDIVLVEGPPEADAILQWVSHNELKPPVALLCYQPDNPQLSSFYPFAEFSPEWQAILYARNNNIPVRFMDLPVVHQFAIEQENKLKEKNTDENKQEDNPTNDEKSSLQNMALPHSAIQYKCAIRQQFVAQAQPKLNSRNSSWLHKNYLNNKADTLNEAHEGLDTQMVSIDPITHLAWAAGFDDGEKWWEHMFEHRQNNEEVFTAVQEAMKVLRETFPTSNKKLEQLREAYMRKTIRLAEKEMYQNIAVICGAWHAPALTKMPSQKEDNDLLKGLPKVKVECTWVPWTYNRLSFYSGYGAGIVSPGWYEHIWNFPTDDGTRWMAKVAQLFRAKQMDTSVAHVIEAVRLAASLASLRGLSKAGLEELNEATLSVLCNGESILMALVQDELIVSNKMGEVPVDIPKPPLQLDIEKLQKKLRLPPTADWKDYVLDLRKENDLERSIFLHRLQLLNIKWGEKNAISGKGTFKEQWRLQWDPALSIDIIEKGSWGNTVQEAAQNFVINKAKEANELMEVASLLENAIPAELTTAIEILILQINNLAASSGDVMQLMQVLPGLVNVSRYGNVRKTDAEIVLSIVDTMMKRICISLPSTCTSVDEDAANDLLELFVQMKDAVHLLQILEITTLWQQTLTLVSSGKNTSPIIAGYATRLLADDKILKDDELIKAFYYALSANATPALTAAWIEGFLKGSGTILLIDNDLWMLVYKWVEQLEETVFNHVLPLLRRTFSNFSNAERKRLGEKVKMGDATISIQKTSIGLDTERAKQGIEVVMKWMGYS